MAIFDLSGFAKFRITGRDALAVLERICANRIDVPAGRTVYTAILNSRGGIELDLTVTRLDPTDFLVVSAAGSQQKDFHWICRAIKPEEHAWITDITSAYSVLSVMGPQARALLERVSPADFSNEAFPFATMQTVDIGYARAWAVRLTFVGELGWEIYVPTEFRCPTLRNAYDRRC